MATASGPGLFLSLGAEGSAFQTDYGQRVIYGGTVFGGLHLLGRYGIDGEARFLRLHTDEDVHQTDYLIGPNVQVMRHGPFRPYVKFLIGSGRMTFPFKYATGSYFAMAPGAGLDLHMGPILTVRVVDFEYQDWRNFNFGPMHPYGVSAGISVRLTRPNLFRRDPYVYQ